MGNDKQEQTDETIEALEQNEEHFRQIIENIDQVFWKTSADKSELHDVSPGFERIWGRPLSQLYEHPGIWLDTIHPDDREKIILTLGKQALEKSDEIYRIVRPDGTIRWVRDRAFPVSDDAGQISSLVGVIQDITEEVKLRQESEDRLKQIIQADRLAALGEMVAGVAHEINNPNSFIASNVPLLKETWEIFKPILDQYMAAHPDWDYNGISYADYAQDMEEIIDAIDSGSRRISKIISSLKDFARVDESPQCKPVEINKVVESTLTIVGAKIRKSVVVLDLNLGENLPTIQGHFQKIDQVLANLLVNAAYSVKDTDRGKITVTTRYVSRLRSVLIEVEDNGEGISREARDHIFEPFFTTRRADGGTGLGLSVSYGLVREHNGVISVLSRPEQGSRFTVFLPVNPQHKIKLQPTILCVDDDPAVLKVLQSYFIRAEDMAVETTNDPETVVAHLQEHPEIDIVLSDINMPGMDGWVLLDKIKTSFPLLNVVLYSGHPDSLQPRADSLFQPELMMEKSFNRDRLFEMINSMERLII